MKSFPFARGLVVGTLLCLALPVACGDSEDNPNPTPSGGGEGGSDSGTAGSRSDAGMAGAVALPPGLSATEKTVECGMECKSAKVGGGAMSVFIDPCCAGDAEDACGITTGFFTLSGAKFDEECLAKDQPGEPDEACPSPNATAIPYMGAMLTLDKFAGCCRADTGTCGVVVDAVTAGGGLIPLGALGLGCVDAAPFFPGETPAACGEGAGGGGGSGNVGGGAGGGETDVGGNGAGGASGGAGGGT